MKIKDLVEMALLVAIMFIAKLAFSFLPNIEFVSLLIIVYTLVFGKKTLICIFTFILLEGIFYGFGLWWFNYLYIWPILYFVTYSFRKETSSVFWSIISGGFGLFFGALCSIPYFFIGGVNAGIGYWVYGLVFDIAHCVGNFVICLVLFKPIYNMLTKIHFISVTN